MRKRGREGERERQTETDKERETYRQRRECGDLSVMQGKYGELQILK